MSEKTRRDVDQEISDKAATDADFRAKLLADPATVLSDMGLMVRDGHTVKVVQETSTEKYIVIAAGQAAAAADGELSDDALGAVAAGQFAAGCYSCGAG
jgi:hypothetical protein